MSATIKPGRKRSADEILSILNELDASGSSVAAFAQSRGIALSTLHSWRRKYNRAGKPISENPRRFVPVDVTEPECAEHALVEIVLADDVRVRVRSGFCPQTLAAVIDALTSRCS